ncbi:MAG: hypothetical protein HZC38_14230 [Chloroflexi bacterium]|nr:hypothetical protein [Chloroflexota bacterium]
MPLEKHQEKEIQKWLAKAEWWLSSRTEVIHILDTPDEKFKWVVGEDKNYPLLTNDDGSLMLGLDGPAISLPKLRDQLPEEWRYLQSIACYEKALEEVDPNCVFALLRIGLFHLEKGSEDEDVGEINAAIDAFDQAVVGADDSDPLPEFFLAYALSKLDEYENKTEEYHRTIREESEERYRVTWEKDPFLFIAPPESCESSLVGCYKFGEDCYSVVRSRGELIDIYEDNQFGFPDWGIIQLNLIEIKEIDEEPEGHALQFGISLYEWDQVFGEASDEYKARRDQPGYFMLRLSYAAWLVQANKIVEAEKIYEDLYNSQNYEWLGWLTGYWRDQIWERFFKPMVEFYEPKSPEKAEMICKLFCDMGPVKIDAQLTYINIVSERDPHQGIKVAEDLFSRHPSPEIYCEMVAIYHLKLNDTGGALRVLEEGKVKFGNDPRFMLLFYEYEVQISRDGKTAIEVTQQQLQKFFGDSVWQSLHDETKKDLATAEYLKKRYETVDDFSLASAANCYCRAWQREVKNRINQKIIDYFNPKRPRIYIKKRDQRIDLNMDKATPIQIGIAFDDLPNQGWLAGYIKSQNINARQKEFLTEKFREIAESISEIRNDSSHVNPISRKELDKLRERIISGETGKSQGAIVLLVSET